MTEKSQHPFISMATSQDERKTSSRSRKLLGASRRGSLFSVQKFISPRRGTPFRGVPIARPELYITTGVAGGIPFRGAPIACRGVTMATGLAAFREAHSRRWRRWRLVEAPATGKKNNNTRIIMASRPGIASGVLRGGKMLRRGGRKRDLSHIPPPGSAFKGWIPYVWNGGGCMERRILAD